jgi:hypothetical protein
VKITIFHSLYCAGGYRLAHIFDECRELVEEVIKRDPQGIREEFWDVLMHAQLYAHEHTGWDWKILLPMSHLVKFARRRRTWQKIFSAEGLTFEARFLKNGSNFKKAHKVAAALELARKG